MSFMYQGKFYDTSEDDLSFTINGKVYTACGLLIDTVTNRFVFTTYHKHNMNGMEPCEGIEWVYEVCENGKSTYAFVKDDEWRFLNKPRNMPVVELEAMMIELYFEFGDWEKVFDCVEI